MNINELRAQTRTTRGNSPARALRRDGRVPAVLYGRHIAPSAISILSHDLDVIVKRGGLGRSVFNLLVDESTSPKPVLIKELQTHPVSRAYLHVDLYEVAMDRKIRVNVPLVVTGNAIGVENGGMLQIIRRELEVSCLPNEIPENVTLDVSGLDIGDALHVEDIQLTGNVEIPHDENFTILTISSPTREAAGAEEGEAGAAAEAGQGAATGESGE